MGLVVTALGRADDSSGISITCGSKQPNGVVYCIYNTL